jgi:hypothetical protein
MLKMLFVGYPLVALVYFEICVGNGRSIPPRCARWDSNLVIARNNISFLLLKKPGIYFFDLFCDKIENVHLNSSE